MNKQQVIDSIVPDQSTPQHDHVTCFAPTNIALVKYWGKRNTELNLPATSSLSLTLPNFGTTTTLSPIDAECNELIYAGQRLDEGNVFAKRLNEYLSLFRLKTKTALRVETQNNIPTAAGLASSASGFAALVMALDKLFAWQLDKKTLSILARMGSGSASRSFWPGFVEWQRGINEDGMDSFAKPFAKTWPALCFGIVLLNIEKKAISSRTAMQQTVATSPLYKTWPTLVEQDMLAVKAAINDQEFDALGIAMERNAIAMHATMSAGQPPVSYSTEQTVQAINKVKQLRKQGVSVYFTQDAGPNLKLLFLADNEPQVLEVFPELKIQRF